MNGHEKELVYAWLNKQIKAWKLSNSNLPESVFGYIRGFCNYEKELQIYGIKNIIDILGSDIEWIREDWNANNIGEKTNYDIIYFWYRGFKIFQLVDKGESV